MAIRKKDDSKPFIDISGPAGNAYALLGQADVFGKQLGMSAADRDRVQKEMMAGDYENLIAVFDKYFGEYVDLVR